MASVIRTKGKYSSESKAVESAGKIYDLIYQRLIFFIIGFFGLAIIIQGARWQIYDHERLLALGKSQYTSSQTQTSQRGVIKTKDGTILATDQPAWDAFASLSSDKNERAIFFANKDRFVAEVASILKRDVEYVDSLLHEDFRYIPLSINISKEQKKELEEATERIFTEYPEGVPQIMIPKGFGLYFEQTERRIYPNNTLASHILGFVGRDGEGKDLGVYGVEGYFFGDITGVEGNSYQEKDVFGNVLLTAEYDPIMARKGKDITLTINPGIQKKVEEELKLGVEKQQAKSGSAIIMNPKTGEIIAMANYPNYNPNEYWRTQEVWIFKNKAVADVYEPGSVFKPLTIGIAMEEGVIDENTVCIDETGSLTFFEGRSDERTIYNWNKLPDGALKPNEILMKSNNPCTAKTAMLVGSDKYYARMKEFGVGDFVGIGLQDESNTYVRPIETWNELDLAVTSYGQSISVTPLQMISAIGTIANNGKRMQPYIVSEISDDSEVITFKPRLIGEPLSEEVADKVAMMMVDVSLYGDPRFAFNTRGLNDKYEIAGKTGTAQVQREDQAGYYEDRNIATYVGFSPAIDPEMIMLVRIEEPGSVSYSASTVVPVWADIFDAIAEDLQVTQRKDLNR